MKSASTSHDLGVGIVSLAGHLIPSPSLGRLLVLIYHRVHAERDPMFPGEVDRATFDWQMSLVRRFCTPVGLEESLSALMSGTLPARSVAVTFDDGYADNAEVALPVLESHGISATFFVSPAFLDGGRMWNDSVVEAIRAHAGSELNLQPLGMSVIPTGSDLEKGSAATKVINHIKHLQPHDRAQSVRILEGLVGRELPGGLMLTSQQVRKLSTAGMGIGAHTMTHPILKSLDETEAVSEIRTSRQALEGIIGKPVRGFAYPNGKPGVDYTSRDVAIVRQLGFEFALSTAWGVAHQRSDPFQLPRFTPWDQSPTRWLARLLLKFRNTA